MKLLASVVQEQKQEVGRYDNDIQVTITGTLE